MGTFYGSSFIRNIYGKHPNLQVAAINAAFTFSGNVYVFQNNYLKIRLTGSIYYLVYPVVSF